MKEFGNTKLIININDVHIKGITKLHENLKVQSFMRIS